MSICYDLICVDCKKGVWLGQNGIKDDIHLYLNAKGINKLAGFLKEHQDHHLRFMEDQAVIDAYPDDDIIAEDLE